MIEIEKPLAEEPAFAAFVALDWADKKHAWALQTPGSRLVEEGELVNTPEATQAWAAGLARRFPQQLIAVGLEQRRGAVIAMLSKYAHLVLFPISPTTSAKFRQAFFPSGAKDDPGDARLLLEVLLKHRDRLAPLRPDTVATRALQFLTEDRRKLVDQMTAAGNRLTGYLKLVFPQVLPWFDVNTPVMCALLERWPSLQKLQQAGRSTVEQFLREHQCHDADRNRLRVDSLANAVAATVDPALLEAAQLAMATLLAQINGLRNSIAEYDAAIEKHAKAHPDCQLFSSFPGAGPALTPRLIAAFGTYRDRFATANDVQCFTGIAPVREASGKQLWIHWRWACPKFIRQSVHEMAGHSIRFCGWAREYYDAQRAKNKGHHAAVRALAFKWLRIMFRCWKDGVAYDEARYLQARATRRQAPAGPPDTPKPSTRKPKVLVSSSGGFSKLAGLEV